MHSGKELFRNYTSAEFESKSLEIFRFQAQYNQVYSKFIQLLNVDPFRIEVIEDIPFMPISFFKLFDILSVKKPVVKVFTSSGTTGNTTSKHLITDLDLYHLQLKASFEYFYGNFKDYSVLPLLPAYAERTGSSLIEMVDFWMTQTGQPEKKYFLYDYAGLRREIEQQLSTGKKIILIGVSFALLNFAEQFPEKLNDIIIMETGGMKGRSKEITRDELHNILKTAFQNYQIQSEYGMTELLSQAYAKRDGLFETPPWMKILLRDPEDPFSYVKTGKSGGINIIDFANINSCSFIASEDLGRYHDEKKLEILGRFDNSDIRGCNLMAV